MPPEKTKDGSDIKGWMSKAAGPVIPIVVYLLLQFGLVGPGANDRMVEQERRLTRVEYEVQTVQKQQEGSKDMLREMLEPMQVQMTYMAEDLKEIKMEMKGRKE